MKFRNKIIAGVGAALIALGLSTAPAMAAPPSTATETIYVDPTGMDAYASQLNEAARDWSKNTGVKVVVAPCSGDNCIHINIIEGTPCSTGGVIIGQIGGCAYASPDPGACQNTLNAQTLRSDYWLAQYIIKHEIGHCIYWFGGAGFIHLDSKNALMKDGFSGYPRESQTRLTSEDRSIAKSLFT